MLEDDLSSRKAKLSTAKQSLLEKWTKSGARENSVGPAPDAAAHSSLPGTDVAAVTTTGTRTPEPRRRVYRLPNGLEIAYKSKVEADHFYEDIFEKQCYLKGGINLREGDCVFDIGANIGLFTLFAARHRDHLLLYTFEPAPPLFDILRFNVNRNGIHAKLFNCGISDETKMAELTFYPSSSGMSSFYADKNEEKDVLRSLMHNQMESGVGELEALIKYEDELFDERFRSETFTCQLRTLSDVIAAERIRRIDLLKVDVQKSEYDVLSGIAEQDWGRIRQIVLEIHDLNGRLGQITSLLEKRGFEVNVEQDDLLRGSVLYNAYAIRKRQDDRYEVPDPTGD